MMHARVVVYLPCQPQDWWLYAAACPVCGQPLVEDPFKESTAWICYAVEGCHTVYVSENTAPLGEWHDAEAKLRQLGLWPL